MRFSSSHWLHLFCSIAISIASTMVISTETAFAPLQTLSRRWPSLLKVEVTLLQRIDITRMDEIGVWRAGEPLKSNAEHAESSVEHSHDLLKQPRWKANQLATQSSIRVENQQNDINQIATAVIHERCLAYCSRSAKEPAELTEHPLQASLQPRKWRPRSDLQQNRDAITSLATQVEDAANVIREPENNAQRTNQILSTIQALMPSKPTSWHWMLPLKRHVQEQGRGFGGLSPRSSSG